ncbi:MAG: hypothetical protein J1F39_02025 [Clostridiales bacterium]|nr:hypothetical protein [Clostridiales bacterium]
MFLSLSQPVIITLVVVIAAQYGFATFCLMKLATIDLPRKNYALWNVFIILVFFIGGIVFLIYYSKVKESLRIPPYVPTGESEGGADAENATIENENAEDSREDIFEEAPSSVDGEDGDGNADIPEGEA